MPSSFASFGDISKGQSQLQSSHSIDPGLSPFSLRYREKMVATTPPSLGPECF